MIYSGEGYRVEAWIERNDNSGVRFPEYRETDVEDEESGLAGAQHQCYLACEEGASFSIKFSIVGPERPSTDAVNVDINIDGRNISSLTISDIEGEGEINDEGEVSTMFVDEDGEMLEADLTFAPMPKTDDQDLVEIRGPTVDALGKIQIELWWGTQVTIIEGDDLYEPPGTSEASLGAVHEKKMGLGSAVQATNLRPYEPESTSIFTPAEENAFICRFIWKYHTPAELGFLGVIGEDELPPLQQPIAPGPSQVARGNMQNVKREAPADEGDYVIGPSKRANKGPDYLDTREMPITISEINSPKRRRQGKAGIIDLTKD